MILSSKAIDSGKVQFACLPLLVLLCTVLPARSQSQLPEGNGKQMVERACVQCHDLQRVTSARYSREDWQDVVNVMVNNFGATLSRDEIGVVAEYLAKNFVGEPTPAAVVIPGSVEVSIKEWVVPNGARPHDPLVAPDGSIWYTGIAGNVLGRFDPKTGQFKEYPLRTPDSRPHGLIADKEGTIWFTSNGAGYVGQLNPKTGEITEHRMPDPKALGPHTPIFDQKGMLWFTMSGDNMVGRINPKTGEVKLAPTPSPGPYGIVVNSKGIPFFTEFRSKGKLASIDPETMKIQEYALLNPDTRPRRIAVTSDDVLWYTDYARGYMGRLDAKTGKASEWPSPSGPKSAPYGITAVKDIIWYSESGVKPNTLVRFDPKTEKFQTWIIPSGGGVVRHMVTAPNGNLWLATSGVNGIALVEIKDQ